jgi:hypothetical protein
MEMQQIMKIILAILPFTCLITPLVSGGIFAIAIVPFGGLSRGFSKESQ